MFAETLEEGRSANPQMQSKYLRTIVNESERLSRLVDNVLDFARIEQDRKIYQMQRISLADVVRSATQAIQYPLVRQNFELKVAVDDDLPPLMADPDAVEQAILNLLANAMKYSGSSRQIDLQLRRDSHGADFGARSPDDVLVQAAIREDDLAESLYESFLFGEPDFARIFERLQSKTVFLMRNQNELFVGTNDAVVK